MIEIYQMMNYHNCGILNKEQTLKDLQNIKKSNEVCAFYKTPYWNYYFNYDILDKSRIYGKFMLFSYEPEILIPQYKEIIEYGLSPLIKFSTDKKSFQSKGKSKITCIYTDRNYKLIKELAYFIKHNNMVKKNIPFQAPYDYYNIKTKMMLDDFL